MSEMAKWSRRNKGGGVRVEKEETIADIRPERPTDDAMNSGHDLWDPHPFFSEEEEEYKKRKSFTLAGKIIIKRDRDFCYEKREMWRGRKNWKNKTGDCRAVRRATKIHQCVKKT